MARHLQREIERLKKKILALGAIVEDNLRQAFAAIESRDADAARQVILADLIIDENEVEVEEECLKLLALYQPVAVDLRYIVAVIKINNELERIGDLGANVAERAAQLAQTEPIVVPAKLLLFPDEGHWINKPQNSALFYHEFIAWMDKWVK